MNYINKIKDKIEKKKPPCFEMRGRFFEGDVTWF